MGAVPTLLNHQLVSKKLGKSSGGKKSLISPGRLWSSLGNRIWKHRFSKLGELGSALERRHTDFLAPGETGAPRGLEPTVLQVFTRPLLFLQGSGLSPRGEVHQGPEAQLPPQMSVGRCGYWGWGHHLWVPRAV